MESSPPPSRTTVYNPALAFFAAAGGAWVFLLVTLGAFTTSINAGMVFSDWPLSNGSLNPTGWLSDITMFAEHSHRLSAGVMSAVTLVLAVWLWKTETRAWLKNLSVFAAILVFTQAIVGGLRVLLDFLKIPMMDTSLGRLFAMLHACLAQLFVCVLIAIAVSCSRRWIERSVPIGRGVRRTGIVCCVLLFLQLGIAAVMRHSFAGLAIPNFPWSGPDHALLPQVWSFKVGIHFAHRAMAAIITVALILFAIRIWRDRRAPIGMRMGAGLLISLLALQLMLGASIIWTLRDPAITTGHVLVGAFTLATTFWLTWLAHRDALEAAGGGAEPLGIR